MHSSPHDCSRLFTKAWPELYSALWPTLFTESFPGRQEIFFSLVSPEILPQTRTLCPLNTRPQPPVTQRSTADTVSPCMLFLALK